MNLEKFIEKEGNLQDSINAINRRVRAHTRGKIDGLVISKSDVMNQTKSEKQKLVKAWEEYSLILKEFTEE